MKFRSKAITLNLLKNLKFNVPNLIYFNCSEFLMFKDKILNKVNKTFKHKIAVRSSSFFEDGKNTSMAGQFTSILNVSSNNKEEVYTAIQKVIKSMEKFKHKNNQVLIQDMVKNVKISGVIMSCDKENSSPYYIINYDKSGDTTKVTSGQGINESFIYFKNPRKKPQNKNFLNLINLTTKLSKVFKYKKLDIEFAIDNKNKVA